MSETSEGRNETVPNGNEPGPYDEYEWRDEVPAGRALPLVRWALSGYGDPEPVEPRKLVLPPFSLPEPRRMDGAVLAELKSEMNPEGRAVLSIHFKDARQAGPFRAAYRTGRGAGEMRVAQEVPPGALVRIAERLLDEYPTDGTIEGGGFPPARPLLPPPTEGQVLLEVRSDIDPEGRRTLHIHIEELRGRSQRRSPPPPR